MKKLPHTCILCLMVLTLSHCTKDNGGTECDSSNSNNNTVGSDEYVDLGLRSMTLWKAANEVNESDLVHDYYTYNEAVLTFGDKLPSKEQFEELIRTCRWQWLSVNCYKVNGPNGKYIFMPVNGSRDCEGRIEYVGTYGFYWSSTPDGPTRAWYLNFYSSGISMYNYYRCYAASVRLVKDIDDYK